MPPPEQRNIIAVLNRFPEIGKWAIFIRKKFGQEIIKPTGGRKIHSTSAIPGGVNQNLSIEDRDALRKEVDQIVDWCCAALRRHRTFVEENQALHRDFASYRSNFISLVGRTGGWTSMTVSCAQSIL